MRRNLFLAFVIFFGFCMISGCKKKTKAPDSYPRKQASYNSQATLAPTSPKAKDPQTRKAVIVSESLRRQLLNRDKNRVLLNADYNYPQIENLGGLESIELINQEIKEVAEKEFEKNYKDVEAFAIEFDLVPMEPGRPSSMLPLVSEQTFEVKYNDDYLVSVFVTTFNHFGGAHPDTTYSSYTYDVRSGEKLTAAYFLPDRKTEEEVKQYVAEVFYTVYNKDKESFYPDTGEILTEGRFTYGYYITKEDIVFYINPYEIAPYAAGLQEVKVPREATIEGR